jgi:hypothetical protein
MIMRDGDTIDFAQPDFNIDSLVGIHGKKLQG